MISIYRNLAFDILIPRIQYIEFTLYKNTQYLCFAKYSVDNYALDTALSLQKGNVRSIFYAWHRFGADGGTRTPTGFRPTDFRTSYGFHRPRFDRRVCGLDYPFTLSRHKGRDLGAARLVSTPSRPGSPDPGLARDCHLTGFPEFEQFYIAGFPSEHSSLAQVRCVYQFRHARVARDK